MDSNTNDRWKSSRDQRSGGKFSNRDEGHTSKYSTWEEGPHENYGYGGGHSREHSRESSGQSYVNSPGNLYRHHGGHDTDYGPGYSTANDFSGQEPARGRLHASEHRRDYRGYDEEDYPRYVEMYRRSEYPETYRSAMSGYMSEHVGDDSGRRDYNPNPNEGNLYGSRYRSGNQRRGERGYMREDDYDRGTPFRGGSEGRYKGKGPRNYRRPDNRIEDDINDRLTDDPIVDASEINVKVQNGEVTLTGTVDNRHAKRRAEDIAESVSGVTHVENLVRTHPAASTNPGVIVTPY